MGEALPPMDWHGLEILNGNYDVVRQEIEDGDGHQDHAHQQGCCSTD